MTTNKSSFIQSVWDFFCSLKLSIFLLIALAVTSIIGTIIPQAPQREYLEAIGPAKIKLYSSLGFFDMYHSWWFILLLYLLTINLIACSIKRLPRVWKYISEPTLIFDDGLEKTLSLTHQVKVDGNAASVRDKMAEFLKSQFAAPVVTEVDGDYHLFAQKHQYCRLGVYVVHLSIIIVFIGALIGSYFGYKADVQIVEGTSVSAVHKRGVQVPHELGFEVRCEDFSVSYYDTGAPKEFKSILTVLENGQPVQGYQNVPIVVNSPLTYKGITFYQSSYGPATDGSFNFAVRSKAGGAPASIVARKGEGVPVPGGGYLKVLEATEDIRPFMPQFHGPAVRVEYLPPSGPAEFVILLKEFPEFDLQRGGKQVFTYEGGEEKFYTGLQVARDPGVWTVWAGCTLMVVGICLAFFFSHQRVWIRATNGRATIGGSASKNQAAFELAFENLLEKLKKQ